MVHKLSGQALVREGDDLVVIQFDRSPTLSPTDPCNPLSPPPFAGVREYGRHVTMKRSEDRRVERMLARLAAGEKEAFSDAAKLAGVVLSARTRERLRQVAIREPEGARVRIAFLRGHQERERS